MPYKTVQIVFNDDGSILYEHDAMILYMPLESAKRDFCIDFDASAARLCPKYSGKKCRIELRDKDTGEVIDSRDGAVP